ncbi:uncharacterized protein METZ01_LOCUS160019, partial [marine metagenome]
IAIRECTYDRLDWQNRWAIRGEVP